MDGTGELGTYGSPTELQSGLTAWIRVVCQRESSPNDETDDAKKIHGKPEIDNFGRVVSRKVKIGGRAEAKHGTQEEKADKETVFSAISEAEMRIEGKPSDCKKSQGSKQMSVHIDGLIVQVTKACDRFPVVI